MRETASVLVPFAAEDVTAVWCHDRTHTVEWRAAWELADHAQITRPQRIEDDLYGLPLPADGAWVARRMGGVWWYRADRGVGLHAADELIKWALA